MNLEPLECQWIERFNEIPLKNGMIKPIKPDNKDRVNKSIYRGYDPKIIVLLTVSLVCIQ
jgi:hypothetical protein